MASITTRSGKGSPLTHAEVDANFTNLNTDKLDVAGIALGTAASPTVKFTGDPNTGIYSPGADQVAISTGGTGRVLVDASGNVGLNVTPFAYAANARNLHLNGTGYSALTFGTTDGGTGEKYWRWIARTAAPAKSLVLQTLDDTGSNEANAYTVVRSGTAIDYQTWNTGGIERARIDSNGCVGFGMTPDNQAYRLQIYNPSQDVAAISLGNTTSGSGALNGLVILQNQNDTQINNRENGFLSVATNNTERARIDSSGRMLVGTSTAFSTAFAGSALLQVVKNGNNAAQVFAFSSAGQDYPASLELGRGRGTQASPSAVSNGDWLGSVNFYGHDGTQFIPGAYIIAQADGATGTNDLPSRLVFSTTADNASSPTERMRITSTGQVRLAGAGITFNGDTATANELDDYEEGTWTVTLLDNISGGNSSATTVTGDYTKIGNTVRATFSINNIDTTGLTAGNVLYFTLPFTHAATYESVGSCGISSVTIGAGYTSITPFITANAARGYFLTSGNNIAFGNAPVSWFNDDAADLRVTISYKAA